MEILSTTEHTFEFYAVTGFFGLIASIAYIAGLTLIYEIASDWKTEKKFGEIIGTIVVFGIAILFSFGTKAVIEDGAKVSHKVLITDYNEVYNNGYKITGQDGQIYTIENENWGKK